MLKESITIEAYFYRFAERKTICSKSRADIVFNLMLGQVAHLCCETISQFNIICEIADEIQVHKLRTIQL